MARSGLPCLTLALLVLLSSSSTAVASSLRVGVVLDLTSDVGKKSLTSINMALDDFYAAHANATSRVDLRVRDSRGNVVTAAHAGKADSVLSTANPHVYSTRLLNK